MPHAGKRCAFYSLGCKVNQYDTEGLIELFRKQGYEIVDFDSEADVYCINTCTVTHVADRKSRQAARRGKRKNPKAVVVVTGCYAQAEPEKVASIDGVDVVVGTKSRADIIDLVNLAIQGKTQLPIVSVGEIMSQHEFEETPISCFTHRIRGFVKIQEGCDRFCTYCKVPFVRGPSRSRDFRRIIEEVKRLVDSGVKEIVLTGIHVGAYCINSKQLNDPKSSDLTRLINQIHDIPSIGRIRLSSIGPLDINEGLIEIIKELPKVAKHLHIPLQSGDDEILKKMGRRYRTYEYFDMIEKIRSEIPDIAITTDIMVGFPGETEENFYKSYEFIKRLGFSSMHVFKFSKRSGTKASSMANQINPKVMNVRSRKMIKLAKKLESQFCISFIGKDEEILPEDYNPKTQILSGLGSRYINIKISGTEELIGKLIPVRIEKVLGNVSIGKRLFTPREGFKF